MAVREELALSKEEIIKLVPLLKDTLLNSGFVLSTCNRTEIFGFPRENKFAHDDLINLLLEFKPVEGISPSNFNRFFSCSAVRHIFNVATGIDSMIIGDSQILAQVKEAFQLAEELNFTDSVLRRLFDAVVKSGKRAIRETEIGEGAVSVAYAAVQVIEKIFTTLKNKSALVIGAGETGELSAVHLRDKEIGSLTITNRTYKRAVALAEKTHALVLPFDQIKENLAKYDVIISATSAKGYLVDSDDVKNAMKQRRGSPMVIMDIAVPRDVEPEASELENVFYNDIDSLQKIVDANIQKRREEIPLVQKIVLEEMEIFFNWYNTLEVVPTIKAVRKFFEDIREDELRKIKHKVSEEDFLKLEDMTRRMIGRILHNPTINLRKLAENGNDMRSAEEHAAILRELFELHNGDKKEKN